MLCAVSKRERRPKFSRLDLVEFGSKPENAIPDFPFDDEAAQERVPQQLAEYVRRKEEFMRQKTAEGRSQG
jgi:hypothetical protein